MALKIIRLKIYLLKLPLVVFSLFVIQIGAQDNTSNRSDLELLKSDFSASTEGWGLGSLGTSEITEASEPTENGTIFAMPSVLKSEKFLVEELTYHRLKFAGKSSAKALWAMVFFDALQRPLLADVYSSFDASADLQTNTFYFQSKANAVTAECWFRPMQDSVPIVLQSVSISAIDDGREVVRWADSIYQEIPEIQTEVSTLDLERFCPQFLEALRTAKRTRVVMLGNSIINDIGNSGWEVLLEDKYPGAKIEVITSVRGGTGCWYYQNNNQVDTFVLQYNPDLLIIGGISQREDTAAIRNVINQVRTETDCEILLFTGPVGKQGDPRSNRNFAIPPQGDDYRIKLASLAKDLELGFVDMQTDWGRYITASQQTYDFFLRDPVHANARGRQILARLMVRYFTSE